MKLLVAAAILSLVFSCMSTPQRFNGATVIVRSKESVRLNEPDMTIHNAGCGRKWMADGAEKPYCELTVKTKDSTWSFGDSFAPLYIRNYKLVIDKMNPWNREEDSVPAGACRIIITRLDDISR